MFSASPSPTLSLAVGKLRGASTRNSEKEPSDWKQISVSVGAAGARAVPPSPQKTDKKIQGYNEEALKDWGTIPGKSGLLGEIRCPAG